MQAHGLRKMKMHQDKLLDLDKQKKIGQGTVKDVYAYPDSESLVIKVIKSILVAEDGGFSKHGKFKRSINQGIYRQFRREIIQYLELSKKYYLKPETVFPIETPYGLITTSQGLGLVVEKIQSPGGKSLTLEDISLIGQVEDKHLQALEEFFQRCVDMHVVFGEVNYAGLMYTESRSGRPEFVLVDGIGEKLLIPVRSWFKGINTRYIRKVQRRIMAQVEENMQQAAQRGVARSLSPPAS